MLNKNYFSQYLLLTLIGAIWGGQFVLNKIALPYFSSLEIATGRIFFGLLTLSVLLWFFPNKLTQKNAPMQIVKPRFLWIQYGLIGIFEAILPFFLTAWGQQQVNSSVAAILMGTVPIFTMIFSITWFKSEAWSLGKVLSVMLGFIGCVVLIDPIHLNSSGLGNILGELAILASSISFAMSIVLIKKLNIISPVRAVRNILLVAVIPIFILTIIIAKPWQLHFNLPATLALIILGSCCGGVVYVMYVFLIKRAGPTFASLSNYLVPLFGMLFGIFLGGEKFYLYELMALLIIAMALAAASFSKTRVSPPLAMTEEGPCT